MYISLVGDRELTQLTYGPWTNRIARLKLASVQSIMGNLLRIITYTFSSERQNIQWLKHTQISLMGNSRERVNELSTTLAMEEDNSVWQLLLCRYACKSYSFGKPNYSLKSSLVMLPFETI